MPAFFTLESNGSGLIVLERFASEDFKCLNPLDFMLGIRFGFKILGVPVSPPGATGGQGNRTSVSGFGSMIASGRDSSRGETDRGCLDKGTEQWRTDRLASFTNILKK